MRTTLIYISLLAGVLALASLLLVFTLFSYEPIKANKQEEPVAFCGVPYMPESKVRNMSHPGKAVYENNGCGSCHSLNQIYVGPALKEVTRRINFQTFDALLHPKPGNRLKYTKYYQKLNKDYGSMGFHQHRNLQLNDSSTRQIWAYLDSATILYYSLGY